MTGIIIAAAIVGGIGIIIGLFLGISGEKFKVEVDEKEAAIRAELSGGNCGGCGYAGCDAFAAAVAKGEADPGSCVASNKETIAKIAAIMGVEAKESARMSAYVKCKGDCDTAANNYIYSGVKDCQMASLVQNGAKSCNYGCLGFGNCAAACPFDAISIINGVAVVNKDACKACGKCVAACPKNLIELRPYSNAANIMCSSKEKGKAVMDACKTGCIGCTLCEKQCEFGAITMVDNLPVIDYTKCTGCGKCAEKCPKKIIYLS